MKKAIVSVFVVLFALTGFSSKAAADVDVSIGIGLPPVIAFGGPPEVVVIPGSYVYVVPDIHDDIYFYGGYWWRPWRGAWYRSRYYDRGWVPHRHVPYALRRVPSHWRDDYSHHRWKGREWRYDRIPHHRLQRDWWMWQKNKRWDKPNNRQTRYPEGRNYSHRRGDRGDYKYGEWREGWHEGRDDRGDRYDRRDRDDRGGDRYDGRDRDDRGGDRYDGRGRDDRREGQQRRGEEDRRGGGRR